MNNEHVSLMKIQKLCKEFQVDFKLEVQGDNYIIYVFGPIRWSVYIGDTFCLEHYIEIVKRLSATFPEKVLKDI